MKWTQIGKTVNADGTTIVYRGKDPLVTIESRKRHIPHAGGRGGTWDHTSYHICLQGVSVAEKYRLQDAKEYAKKISLEV